MKNRREFGKTTLSTAALLLSGAGLYETSAGNKDPECSYESRPTYSVSVSPEEYRFDSCIDSYEIDPAKNGERPAAMPEELYENSSSDR